MVPVQRAAKVHGRVKVQRAAKVLGRRRAAPAVVVVLPRLGRWLHAAAVRVLRPAHRSFMAVVVVVAMVAWRRRRPFVVARGRCKVQPRLVLLLLLRWRTTALRVLAVHPPPVLLHRPRRAMPRRVRMRRRRRRRRRRPDKVGRPWRWRRRWWPVELRSVRVSMRRRSMRVSMRRRSVELLVAWRRRWRRWHVLVAVLRVVVLVVVLVVVRRRRWCEREAASVVVQRTGPRRRWIERPPERAVARHGTSISISIERESKRPSSKSASLRREFLQRASLIGEPPR